MNFHIDKNIGVSGSKIYWMKTPDGKEHWCRMPIAFMGSFNTSEEYRKKHSPFEKGYQDNFVEGKGSTQEEAFNNMQKNLSETADMLWAE